MHHFWKLGSGPRWRAGSGPIWGPKKGHLGPEPNFHFVKFFGNIKNKKIILPPVFGERMRREKKKLGQNLPVKMAKIGPEPDLTACIYIYIEFLIMARLAMTNHKLSGLQNESVFEHK